MDEERQKNALAWAIWERRQMLQLNQPEVAERLGVTRRTIGRYESSASVPRDPEHIRALAQFLKISPDHVVVLSNTPLNERATAVDALLGRLRLLQEAVEALYVMVDKTANDVRTVIERDMLARTQDVAEPKNTPALTGR